MITTTITDIPVSEIDLSDTGFRVTEPHHEIEHLSASISQYGIMVAPLVLWGQNKYSVVSGFRRIEAARHVGLSQITCRVMPAENNLDAAMAAVTENAFSRELTPAELIRATALLLRFMDAKSIAKNATSIFNRLLNTGYINTLARIHAMPDSVLYLLDQGKISIKACKNLVSMDADTLTEFLHLFSLIKVSSGLQMEIITWAKEICALEKISLSRLIQESPLGGDESDGPQGGSDLGHRDMSALGKQFKAFLAQRRFPALTAAKDQAREHIKALELDSGLQLAVPENFEGIVYAIQMEFKNMDEFKTRFKRLAELADHHSFKALVDRKI
ncbi:transcriptional regulator [Desulfobacter hydrogenophilus]|uniref:Transcriptional regulator n=1 Tax=Desulfobacter hydrogenophilus TaxID=2291 RepID=A0A328FC36_9BACT|nr:ParB/RepB/Spo0J family partition protein [Desulfobacter hydrogenophilus]NDY73947.1 ParB N-terminal domain-containing protein [Desulfobacter hydrogenophilus]QBH14657.1 transcriptional regulator [Desulfobacter hydrogenophilus]RAM00982.1 transcriptional regulator [Desulfobacter hydrogenophilus]